MDCSECGANLDDTERYCFMCGKETWQDSRAVDVGTSMQERDPQPANIDFNLLKHVSPNKDKRGVVFWGSIALLALILWIAGGLDALKIVLLALVAIIVLLGLIRHLHEPCPKCGTSFTRFYRQRMGERRMPDNADARIVTYRCTICYQEYETFAYEVDIPDFG